MRALAAAALLALAPGTADAFCAGNDLRCLIEEAVAERTRDLEERVGMLERELGRAESRISEDADRITLAILKRIVTIEERLEAQGK